MQVTWDSKFCNVMPFHAANFEFNDLLIEIAVFDTLKKMIRCSAMKDAKHDLGSETKDLRDHDLSNRGISTLQRFSQNYSHKVERPHLLASNVSSH